MRQTILIIMLLADWSYAQKTQSPIHEVVVITEVSQQKRTVFTLSQNKNDGLLKMIDQGKSPVEKKVSKDKIRNIENQLVSLVWDYKYKQNMTSVSCPDYTEVKLANTEDTARICLTDLKNISRIKPYLKWARKNTEPFVVN